MILTTPTDLLVGWADGSHDRVVALDTGADPMRVLIVDEGSPAWMALVEPDDDGIPPLHLCFTDGECPAWR